MYYIFILETCSVKKELIVFNCYTNQCNKHVITCIKFDLTVMLILLGVIIDYRKLLYCIHCFFM